MPNKESAKKRMRQDAHRRARNRWRKRNIKDQITAFETAVHDGNAEVAETEFRKACSILDKVATTSTLHRNTVARRKSRMSRLLRGMKQG